MKKAQVVDLLSVVVEFYPRQVTAETVKAWHAVLADVPFDEALAALREHVRSSTEWVLPAHLLAIVRDRRAEQALVRPSLPDRDDVVCRTLGISPEEWLQRQNEPGFVADMTARAEAALTGVTPRPGVTTLGGATNARGDKPALKETRNGGKL